MLIRVGEQLVVVEFENKGNFVGVFAGHTAQNPQRCSHRVATAFDGKFHNVFGIKINRIGRK